MFSPFPSWAGGMKFASMCADQGFYNNCPFVIINLSVNSEKILLVKIRGSEKTLIASSIISHLIFSATGY
jgi:hypothetical protein